MIVVAIGANLPGPGGVMPLVTCCNAVEALRRLPGLTFSAVSRWYATAPVPPSGQPDYINGVAVLMGEIDPAALLAALQAIEHGAGRVRGLPNAARTLDLDIVAIDGIARDAPDPILPHPRMHERAFVLHPMAEVMPQWRHPRIGRSVTDLIADLPPQEIRVL